MTVAAILKHKGTEVVRAAPGDRIVDVVRRLADRRIGALPVCDADGTVLGMLSERDVIYALAAEGSRALDMTAEQLMTQVVGTATRATTVEAAMRAMTEGRFRHLPVLDGGHLVGLVSIGDVVKAKLDRQEAEVESLKAYVAGAA